MKYWEEEIQPKRNKIFLHLIESFTGPIGSTARNENFHRNVKELAKINLDLIQVNAIINSRKKDMMYNIEMAQKLKADESLFDSHPLFIELKPR